jgi:hypothetical protein
MKLTFVLCSVLLFFGTLSVASAVRAQSAGTVSPVPTVILPFEDVPLDHWAYSSVEALRQAHILVGYPNATYSGAWPLVDDWEYQAWDTVEKAGIVLAYPDSIASRPVITRQQFAIGIAHLLPLINADSTKKRNQLASQNKLFNILQQRQDALDSLKALIDEFTPELEQMGLNPVAAGRRLISLMRFPGPVEVSPRTEKAPAK